MASRASVSRAKRPYAAARNSRVSLHSGVTAIALRMLVIAASLSPRAIWALQELSGRLNRATLRNVMRKGRRRYK
jgi:hypothetical protein